MSPAGREREDDAGDRGRDPRLRLGPCDAHRHREQPDLELHQPGLKGGVKGKVLFFEVLDPFLWHHAPDFRVLPLLRLANLLMSSVVNFMMNVYTSSTSAIPALSSVPRIVFPLEEMMSSWMTG